ncbi:MAG: helix-hairpin-helix domain-containing protein [Bacteroidota bacterium]
MNFLFPFSRRQNRGFGLLMLFLLLTWSAAKLYAYFTLPLRGTLPFDQFPVFAHQYSPPCIEINQAAQASWDSLPGIGAKLSQRIIKYRQKRGGFTQVTDLQGVYGLREKTYQKIQAHLWMEKAIVLRPQLKTYPTKLKAKPTYQKTSYRSRSLQQYTIVDLNQADSTQLEALPGIGPKLASRILKYRQILEYYYHVDQLRAVYGLSEENFQRMRPYLTAIRPPSADRASINTASRWQIQRLAFWDKPLADSLLIARRQLGRFDQWEEVSQLSFVPHRGLEELMVYFKLESVSGK